MTSQQPNAIGREWDWAGAGARTLIGLVFLASGLNKIAVGPEEFAATIEAYYILSPKALIPAAWTLPIIEIFLGLALMAGYMSGFLTLAFDSMKATVDAIAEAGLRDQIKIISDAADEIGKLMSSNLISEDALSAAKSDDYESFLKIRSEDVQRAIMSEVE